MAKMISSSKRYCCRAECHYNVTISANLNVITVQYLHDVWVNCSPQSLSFAHIEHICSSHFNFKIFIAFCNYCQIFPNDNFTQALLFELLRWLRKLCLMFNLCFLLLHRLLPLFIETQKKKRKKK